MGVNPFGGQAAMGQFGQGGLGLPEQPQGIPRGHGRRHSVNVLNKSSNQPGLGSMFANSQDGFDDGFVPPPALGGHARNDSSWRISKSCFYSNQ